VIRRIELVNFMSHARTVIEPAEGLTVLVGPNNCGKSALVAALQILCNNDNSTYVTRHNERECSITIETDDGHAVQWCRKNNSPRYTIDGQSFDRLDRGGFPPSLHEVLRLPKVIAEGDREFDVHFGEQKSPVFLVDKPGSYAAQFFASSSDAVSLVEMQKRHQQKTADARRERLRLEAQAAKLASELGILSATDHIQATVSQLESQHSELGQLESKIEELTRDIHAIRQASESLARHATQAAALSGLNSPPALPDPQALAVIIDELTATKSTFGHQTARATRLSTLPACPAMANERQLSELVRDLQFTRLASNRLYDECAAMNELAPPPTIIESAPLRIAISQIGVLAQELQNSRQTLVVLQRLEAVPVLQDEAVLRADLRTLARATRLHQRTVAAHDCLATLPAIPEWADEREIDSAIRGLVGASASLSAHTQNTAQAEETLREAERLLRAWAEEQQVCPTCGSPLDANQLVRHAETGTGAHLHG
jgi:energy-coupling factor transporter ATP-binding protein EcfA2